MVGNTGGEGAEWSGKPLLSHVLGNYASSLLIVLIEKAFLYGYLNDVAIYILNIIYIIEVTLNHHFKILEKKNHHIMIALIGLETLKEIW